MKPNRRSLIRNLVLPLCVGGLSALITKDSMKLFSTLNQPPLSPPGWLFPVVWSILFLFMGISAYLIDRSGHPRKDTALLIYKIQLAFNFLWPVLFFRWHLFFGAFFWIILLWVLILAMILSFYNIKPLAGILQIPYLLWVTFASYLNFAIYLLNK